MHFFRVKKGKVVLQHPGKSQLKLKEGDFFGELAIFSVEKVRGKENGEEKEKK